MGETFYLKAGDTAPTLEATLTDANGDPIDVTNADVDFQMSEPRGGPVVIDAAMSKQDAANGVVAYSWTSGDTDSPGRYRAEIEVTYGDGSVETFPNDDYHTILIQRATA